MPGFLFGFIGAFLLLFMTPFSAVPGYHLMAVVFAVSGALFMATALATRISRISLLSVVVINLLLALFLTGLTSQGVGYIPSVYANDIEGVKTIQDAIATCRDSGETGWELVAYAQNLTAKKFTYSRKNPWDTPSKAFERGEGFCLQEALALKEIYDGLGIDSRVVYCLRCRFPAAVDDGRPAPASVSAHTWLKVKIDGEELDVCPGAVTNSPGVVTFTPLSGVAALPAAMQPVAHILSVVASVIGVSQT